MSATMVQGPCVSCPRPFRATPALVLENELLLQGLSEPGSSMLSTVWCSKLTLACQSA